MKGNDQKRQILLSYYESDKPIDELTYARTKRTEIKEEGIPGQMCIEDMQGEE